MSALDLAWVVQLAEQQDAPALERTIYDHEELAANYRSRGLDVSEREHQKVARWAEFYLVQVIAAKRAAGEIAALGDVRTVKKDPTRSPYYYVKNKNVLKAVSRLVSVDASQFAEAIKAAEQNKNLRRTPVMELLGLDRGRELRGQRKAQRLANVRPKSEILSILNGACTTLQGVNQGLEQVAVLGDTTFTEEEITQIEGYFKSLGQMSRTIHIVRAAIKEKISEQDLR